MADANARGKTVIAPETGAGDEDGPVMIFGKSYPTYVYTDYLVQYPTLFCAFYLFLPLLLAVLSLTYSPNLDLTSSSMSIRDHWSQQNYAAADNAESSWISKYNAALQSVSGKTNGVTDTTTRVSISSRLYITYTVNAAKYLAFTKNGANASASQDLLGSTDALNFIHTVESAVRNDRNYQLLCWRSPFRGTSSDLQYVTYNGVPSCTPFTSVLTYYRPGSMNNLSGRVYWDLDGITGAQQVPLDDMKKIVFTNGRAQWFMDQSASYSKPNTSMLRTQIALGQPYATQIGYSDSTYKSLTNTFLDNFISMMDGFATSHPYIDVGYGGDGIESRLVNTAVNRDSNLIIPAVVFIVVVLWYHFHSLILACLTAAQIAATYPSGYVIYMAASGRDLSLLSSLNVFVVLIIATNSAMIFFDTFKQSGFMSTTGRRNLLSVSQRMAYTYRKAGVGVTIASLVAATCFGIASTSKVPAISSFGTLMVCLICVNWFAMMTLFPAAILFHHFHISGRRRNLQRQKEILLAKGLRRRDPNMMMFLTEEREMHQRHGAPSQAEMKTFMDGELEHELQSRGSRGIWSHLGIASPVRAPNPFKNTQSSMALARTGIDERGDGGAEMSSTFEDSHNEHFDQQAFLDQFQDANATMPAKYSDSIVKARPPEVAVQFDMWNLDLGSTFKLSNINTDELLGFDDAPVRYKLMELGATTPAQLTDAQLQQLAPVLGVQPQGSKAAGRLLSVTRQAVVLMYGGGRSLHRPSEGVTQALEQQMQQRQLQNGDGANGAAAAATAEVKNTRFGFTKRISDWWADRRSVQRKWCCGLLGQRVGETQEEMEARIMTKAVKHEGYSRAELLFFNAWAPAVHKARYVILVLATVWIIIASVFTASLRPLQTTPDLIGNNPITTFNQLMPRFGQTGTCDYCSAFFQPITSFPVVDVTAVQTCATTTFGGAMMTAWVDTCGVCRGSDSCVDCRGQANGPYQIDTCGQCLLPTDIRFDGCTGCSVVGNIDSSMNCTDCRVRLSAAYGYTGYQCTKYCDPTVNCPSSRGTCNAITGNCLCHADYERGFWQDDIQLTNGLRCTQCLSGFTGDRCTIECTATDGMGTPCNCDTNTSRCTSCAYALAGPQCVALIQQECNPIAGLVTPFGNCECVTGFDSRTGCWSQTACSSRGLIYTAFQLPSGALPGCRCYGQWRGPSCSYCKCFNGGTCNLNGTCTCPGGWGGVDCQQCTGTCVTRGACPFPYPVDVYPNSMCRAMQCTDAELFTSSSTTSACKSCDSVGVDAICSRYLTSSTCWANSRCEWDAFTGSCRRGVYANTTSNYTTCACNGQWSGPQCATCNNLAHPGTTCQEHTGVLLGCDGQPAVNGQYKVVDQCGTCGGSTQCAGCDGIAGSGKKLDLCGVCGGDNSCAAAAAANGGSIVKPTALVRIAFGIQTDGSVNPEFDFTDPDFQSHLLWICEQLETRTDLVKPAQTGCFVTAFNTFLQAQFGKSLPVALDASSTFNIHQALYQFVVANGRLTEVGFTTADPTDASFKTAWIIAYARTSGVYDDSSVSTQSSALSLWQRIMSNINDRNARGKQGAAIMASTAWVRYFTQLAYRNGAIFILVVAGLAFTAVIATITCSLSLTAIAVVTLASNILTVLSIFRMLDWTLGPIELVALALLMGLAGEQLIHMSEGYLEYLHAAQSHMFARETTRLQAVKGMYQRTGVSTLLSGVTVIISSLFLYLAKVLVIRKVAGVMVVLMLSLMVHTLIVQGALLCAVGPVVSFRNRRTAAIFGGVSSLVLILALGLLIGLGAIGLV